MEPHSYSYTTINLTVEQSVATLTLKRPERLNSFTEGMHAEVREALQRVTAAAAAAGSEAVRCLVLTGAGRAFCSGQDLAERKPQSYTAPLDLGHTLETLYKPLILTLHRLPVPVIAAVNGVAAGAGANLALACDLVIAARSASFIQSFSRLGLTPDCGGSWSLPRKVGLARAMGLALLAEPLTATQAEAWGLIWRCVDDDQFLGQVAELARQLADGPTAAYAATKAALHGSATVPLERALDNERDAQRALGRSADYREGVAAFMAKRPAKFVGH